MSIFSRSPKTSRAYPAAGTSVTGDVGRFRRHKTSGARKAAAEAEAWETKDRKQDRKGTWYRPAR